MSRVPTLVSSLQTTDRWLAELASELGWTDHRHAYVAMRATLHALRDRLTVDEAAQLAAQLPLVVRGVFFEGWDPSATPRRFRDRESFLEPIEKALLWEPWPAAERVARAVFALLCRHVSDGEIEDVLGSLPRPLRDLFPVERVLAFERREPVPAGAEI